MIQLEKDINTIQMANEDKTFKIKIKVKEFRVDLNVILISS